MYYLFENKKRLWLKSVHNKKSDFLALHIYIYIYILAEIPVMDWVQKEPSKIVLLFMKVTALILLNVLEQNIHKLLLPGFSPKIIIYPDILLNSILVYLNKNIVNNHVDYKTLSIFVTQKKGMPVFCKRSTSFIPDIILFFISIFWFINWSSHHIDCSFCM